MARKNRKRKLLSKRERSRKKIKLSDKVTSPYGNVLHHKENATIGQFAFTTQESETYLACFEAEGKSHGNKDISINIDWKTGIAAKDWNSIAKKEKIEASDVSCGKAEGVIVGATVLFNSKTLMKSEKHNLRLWQGKDKNVSSFCSAVE